MTSPVTLRLSKQTRVRIARIARRKRVTASTVIREAIDSWVGREEAISSPYEVVADLIGVIHGGNPKRSVQTGRQFARLLRSRRVR